MLCMAHDTRQVLAISTDAPFHTPEDDARYLDVATVAQDAVTNGIKVGGMTIAPRF